MKYISVLAHGAEGSFARNVQENPQIAVDLKWERNRMWIACKAVLGFLRSVNVDGAAPHIERLERLTGAPPDPDPRPVRPSIHKERLGNVQTKEVRQTALGEALYVRVFRDDDGVMSWREIWETLQRVYPGVWACEWFPPAQELVDQANTYHLFVFPGGDEPAGMNIRRLDTDNGGIQA